jgi:hypothetical protein
MSTVVCITLKTAQNLNSAQIGGVSLGLQCITSGLKELNYAYEKNKQITDCDNQIIEVQLLIKTLEGKMIGIVEKQEGFEFVAEDLNCAITLAAIKKIKQRYSKYTLLHELESKGYAKIKEEKLPNGKIRMVVEKWE